MNKGLCRLKLIMDEQITCIGRLLDSANEETTALKEDNIESLSRVCNDMMNLSHILVSLESERVSVHGMIAADLGLPTDCNFRDLWMRLPLKNKGEFKDLKILANDLNHKYREFQELNDLNKMLLKQSINYASCLCEAADPGRKITYGKSGEFEQGELGYSSLNRTV